MTTIELHEWIVYIEELRQRLPPEMVQRVIVLAAERDAATSEVARLRAVISKHAMIACGS